VGHDPRRGVQVHQVRPSSCGRKHITTAVRAAAACCASAPSQLTYQPVTVHCSVEVGASCRAFHISEDVFAGYNHTLRGAQTKFLEYISVGKGRDMGFDSINSFESKVFAGAEA
jgi:1,3-beta-glucan synthase component